MELNLVKLAKDRSPASRKQLLPAVTDTVIAKIHDCTDTDMSVFGEIALVLYDTTPKVDLERIAHKVAPYANMPVEFAKRLAEDHIRIAEPILAEFFGFTESDLLDLASRLDDTHLQILAERPDLTVKITDVIVVRGSEKTHVRLTGNDQVRLSATSFLNLIHKLKTDPAFLETLFLRPDLTPSICEQLMPNVDGVIQSQLRNKIKSSFTPAQKKRMVRLKQVRKSLGETLTGNDISKLWSKCQVTNVEVNEVISVLLQDERLEHVATYLSRDTRITNEKVRTLLFNGPADRAASFCLTAGLDLSTFAMLAQVRCRKMRFSMTKAEEWIAEFQALLDVKKSPTETRSPSQNEEPRERFFAAKRKKREPRDRSRKRRKHLAAFN